LICYSSWKVLACPGSFQPAFFAVAMFITQGQVPFVPCWIFASLANLLGNVLGYLIGNKLGEPFVLKLKFLRLEPEDIEDLRSLANKYGPWVVVISRWFGPIRTPTILLAGTLGMNLPVIRCFLPWERLAGISLGFGRLGRGQNYCLPFLAQTLARIGSSHADWLGSGFCKSDGGYGAWHRYKNNVTHLKKM